MLKEEKGITLVALVLIIVVLLILSGVAISVVVQNSDNMLQTPKGSMDIVSSDTATITYEDARDKVKLVFKLCEANYQIDLAKGDATDRKEVFTSQTLLRMFEEYNVPGNTSVTLGDIDLTQGVKVNYGDEYTFIVRVTAGGMVTVVQK